MSSNMFEKELEDVFNMSRFRKSKFNAFVSISIGIILFLFGYLIFDTQGLYFVVSAFVAVVFITTAAVEYFMAYNLIKTNRKYNYHKIIMKK